MHSLRFRLAAEALGKVNPNAKIVILHYSVNKARIDRVDGFTHQEGLGSRPAPVPPLPA